MGVGTDVARSGHDLRSGHSRDVPIGHERAQHDAVEHPRLVGVLAGGVEATREGEAAVGDLHRAPGVPDREPGIGHVRRGVARRAAAAARARARAAAAAAAAAARPRPTIDATTTISSASRRTAFTGLVSLSITARSPWSVGHQAQTSLIQGPSVSLAGSTLHLSRIISQIAKCVYPTGGAPDRN